MSEEDLELLIRIAGNLEGVSAAMEDNKPLATYLYDISEWINGIIERNKAK